MVESKIYIMKKKKSFRNKPGNNIFPLKKCILERYFNHEDFTGKNSASIESLGYISPEHAGFVKSDTNSL